MSYQFYEVLHFVGIFMILISLGGIGVHVVNGGTRDYPNRKLMGAIHGIGLLIALTGGFGLLARLGMVRGLPPWAIAKLVVWVLLGGIPVLFYRKPNWGKGLLVVVLFLAALNGWFAIYKPGFGAYSADAMETTESGGHDHSHHGDDHEDDHAHEEAAEAPAEGESQQAQ